MTSSRLPGKVLKTACGRPLLELMIERVKRMGHIDEIVIATTVNDADQPIVDLAERFGVGCYRGSEDDVLGRVLGAVQSVDGDVIVELTGDCPLIDPDVATQVIEFYLHHDFDYVSNDHYPIIPGFDFERFPFGVYEGFPMGIDIEMFSADVLAQADRETQDAEDREHVSLYLIREPKFSMGLVPAPPNHYRPELRLTLDYESDYLFIRKVFEALYPTSPEFSLSEILAWVDANQPELSAPEGDQ
jgi:spore coat polysaccharide biosynthesis protein SpsF